ncbi:hypothetical protein P5V15_002497 [Pogonomyrmex californicus]
MLNFYRFLPFGIAETQVPLNGLLGNKKKKADIEWNSEAQKAFEQTTERLAHATLLAHSRTNTQLAIFADASDQRGRSVVITGRRQLAIISIFLEETKPRRN